MKHVQDQPGISIRPSDGSQYETYAQPLTGQLLRALEMNIVYNQGKGQWLQAEIQGENKSILDMTGGYGANLLGHHNEQIARVATEYLLKGEPSLVQGSSRATSGLLAEKINSILKDETGEGPWVTTLSNSGTEAVEAALKHCLISFANKQQERQQELKKNFNEVKLFIQELDDNERDALTRDWRYRLTHLTSDIKTTDNRRDWLLHVAMQTHDIDGLLSLIEEFNLLQLSEKPVMVALERAYHGKTMGALHLTYNEKYRTPFYVEDSKTVFLPTHTTDVELTKKFNELSFELIDIGIHQIGLFFGKQRFSKVAGLFVEPIQGEAGIYPLSADYLALLKKHSLHENIPLVFDEIQAGTYRTGLMASGHHSHVTADIYCFSKALGGGVAKIGATTIIQKKYVEDFGYLHASTFAEDGYSAAVALESLKLLSNPETLKSGMKKGTKLKDELLHLLERYPDILKDVRGTGLMLAIEFSPKLQDICFEFRIFAEANMLGYIIASAMLHREHIRMSPSLSNGSTLRVQPSIYINDKEIAFFIQALESILIRLKNADFKFFFQHLYPTTPLADLKADEIKADFKKSDRPLSVFLCHLIDGEHVKKVTPAFSTAKNEELEKRLGLMKRAMEFGIYHAQPLIDKNGNESDIILMGIPVTSHELKKSFTGKQRSEIIAKVQRAVDYAYDLGANTVGLGQFTSIVSGNGLYLDSKGMNLTTGNSFTISLAVQAALRDAKEKNIDIASSAVGLVGAAGNIISVAAMIMADHVSKVVLIHHCKVEKSQKLLSVVKTILKESLHSDIESKFNKTLQDSFNASLLNEDQALIDWINDKKTNQFFVVTDDLEALKDCEIIITGASSGQGFLSADHFKKNAVVVDVAVPANIRPEVLEALRRDRKDVSYCLGGVAKIPGTQSIKSPLFPLEDNESYACMAETFSFGFSQEKNCLHIGNLTKSMVIHSNEVAQAAGFELGKSKTKNSL
ncbi:MAG: aminotransferase class III-fold pyridoxal phosphate-dependent enzyme [Bacteriovoracaceae bacterium]|nr:aminotransferase class III-fold pyridoxal phosphate-dependent enzyme [Bacteriovoracaceae bacterium]